MNSSCGLNFVNNIGSVHNVFANAVTQMLAMQCLIHEQFPEDAIIKLKGGEEFDFIIVGAGTAGSLLANRLSNIKDWRVLLIEAGADPPVEAIIPYFSGNLQKSSYDWGFYTEPDGYTNKGCRDGRSYWPRGKMIGGSGSMNSALYVRGHKSDYDAWAAAGNPGWDWESVLPYFKKNEKIIDTSYVADDDISSMYGHDGDLFINKLNYSYPLFVEKLKKGYQEIGLPVIKDVNWHKQVGVGEIRVNHDKGRRVSTATAFLNPVKHRKNLFVIKHSLALNVVIDDKSKTAKGVIVKRNSGIEYTFYAKKEIILSSGSIGTPHILMNSGIGPKSHLLEVNQKFLEDRPVGKNLQDHVRIPVPIKLNLNDYEKKDVDIKAIYEYLFLNSGLFTNNFDHPNVNAFISLDGDNIPEIQIDHNYILKQSNYLYNGCYNIMHFKEEICKQFVDFNKDSQLLIMFVSLSQPHSRGEILLNSTNPYASPLIYSKYFSKDIDLKIFTDGLVEVSKIVNTPTFKSMNASIPRIHFVDCDGFLFNSRDYWSCMAKTLTYNVFHYVGTAKMGKNEDPSAVVDNELKVHGINGLRVVDASVMPIIPRGNTNAATIMISEKASEIIIMDYNNKGDTSTSKYSKKENIH